MRISDWSSDVCSSDLLAAGHALRLHRRRLWRARGASRRAARLPRQSDRHPRMLQGAGADRGDAGQARAATGLGQDSASFSVGSSGRMMRLPAALKWLVIGASAWAAWRLPIVAGELARLGGDKEIGRAHV